MDVPLDESVDFDLSFCGHCNTTTDIKEANFFGRWGKTLRVIID